MNSSRYMFSVTSWPLKMAWKPHVLLMMLQWRGFMAWLLKKFFWGCYGKIGQHDISVDGGFVTCFSEPRLFLLGSCFTWTLLSSWDFLRRWFVDCKLWCGSRFGCRTIRTKKRRSCLSKPSCHAPLISSQDPETFLKHLNIGWLGNLNTEVKLIFCLKCGFWNAASRNTT